MMADSSPHTGEHHEPGLESTVGQVQGPRYREYIKVIIATVLVALFLKTFVVEAYRIPTGSMENTLLVGDFLIVNKLAYGFRTPSRVPFTNAAMPTVRLPVCGHVHRGDVVVFVFPGPYDETRPLDEVNYVKRCIGLPGDTVCIIHGIVMVNGISLALPEHAKLTDGYSAFRESRRATTFPPGTSYTQFNYGPIVVPRRGDTIDLEGNAIVRWKILIEREGHSVLVDESHHVFIDGFKSDRYVIRRNYYFMLGDNRDNSLDSRYWGFVPEDNTVGEALFVYWSWKADSGARSALTPSSGIRWNRIGTVVR